MHRTLNWVLMLATLASAVALYAIKYDTRRLEARVQAQERALEKAENDVTVLMAERAHLARPERLEPLARVLGLAPIAQQPVRAPRWPIARPRAGSQRARRTTAAGRGYRPHTCVIAMRACRLRLCADGSGRAEREARCARGATLRDARCARAARLRRDRRTAGAAGAERRRPRSGYARPSRWRAAGRGPTSSTAHGRLLATDVAVHSLYADPQLILDLDEVDREARSRSARARRGGAAQDAWRTGAGASPGSRAG